ncbi:hypothetical protein IFM89_039876 [Coptis chinensis]|uniref:pyruvate kinase n=1 Tax=Coptis chinensis TaxID=261450 RepID=A0A835LCN9_9MAGN|nr:hypothetical protein IFM89_039876 [Coptis chinensis]
MAQVVAIHTPCSTLIISPNNSNLIQNRLFLGSVNKFSKNESCSRGGYRSCVRVMAKRSARAEPQILPVSPEDVPKREEEFQQLRGIQQLGDTAVGIWSKPMLTRKTKIVCTIGPSTNTREMIWKLAEAGMNVARMNMSHGDHASHQKVIDLVKEYNAENKDNAIAIMLDTKATFF